MRSQEGSTGLSEGNGVLKQQRKKERILVRVDDETFIPSELCTRLMQRAAKASNRGSHKACPLKNPQLLLRKADVPAVVRTKLAAISDAQADSGRLAASLYRDSLSASQQELAFDEMEHISQRIRELGNELIALPADRNQCSSLANKINIEEKEQVILDFAANVKKQQIEEPPRGDSHLLEQCTSAPSSLQANMRTCQRGSKSASQQASKRAGQQENRVVKQQSRAVRLQSSKAVRQQGSTPGQQCSGAGKQQARASSLQTRRVVRKQATDSNQHSRSLSVSPPSPVSISSSGSSSSAMAAIVAAAMAARAAAKAAATSSKQEELHQWFQVSMPVVETEGLASEQVGDSEGTNHHHDEDFSEKARCSWLRRLRASQMKLQMRNARCRWLEKLRTSRAKLQQLVFQGKHH